MKVTEDIEEILDYYKKRIYELIDLVYSGRVDSSDACDELDDLFNDILYDILNAIKDNCGGK